MDQISQIQVFLASIMQTMCVDIQWMQTVQMTPGEASAIDKLANKGNSGTVGVDSIVQPLNVHELNRAADFQLVRNGTKEKIHSSPTPSPLDAHDFPYSLLFSLSFHR